VIILSANGGEALALQMIRESAEDYLVKSSCTEEVVARSIRYALSRHDFRKERSAPSYGSKPAKIVGLIGAKGGVGTTTVAWSFAADLGQQTGEKVLVCDFDFDTGMIAFLAGVAPEHSVEDATENISRLDLMFWQKIVEPGPTGIDILAAPKFYPSVKPDAKTIAELLAKVRRFYGWIVLDLGRQNREATLVCERVDELLLVTTTAITSLYEAKRFYDNTPQTAIDRDRIRLIVNELDKAQQLSPGDLSTLFGNPVCGMLPSDGAELNKAAIEHRLPRESSSFRKEMLKIARRVANLPEAKPKHSASEFFFGRGQANGD
jgi:pilus assembly protein CpaE